MNVKSVTPFDIIVFVGRLFQIMIGEDPKRCSHNCAYEYTVHKHYPK